MKIIQSLARITVLFILFSGAFLFIFAEDSPGTSQIVFLLVKAAGSAFGYVGYRLYKRWRTIDALIAKYEKQCMQQIHESE